MDASSPPTSPPTPGASGWEDYLDIFYAPRRVFARRDSRFWLALLILALVIAVLTWAGMGALRPILDAEYQRNAARMMAQNPNLTAEQIQGSRAFMEKFAPIMAFISMFVIVTLVAALLWGVARVFGAKIGFAAAMMVSTFAQFPRIPNQVLAIFQGFLMKPEALNSQYAVSFSVARFLNPDTTSGLLMGLAGRVDLFTIWVTVLLGMGLYVAGKAQKTDAILTAWVVWVIGCVPALLGGLRG